MERASTHPASGGTIGGIQVLQIVEVLQLLGANARGLRAIVGRSLAGLGDPWVRLPHAVALQLFEYAEHRTGDRLIGLHAGEHGQFRGPLAHLFASAPRLRPALELYGHFSRLAIDTSVVRLDVRGDTASLVVTPGSGTPAANRHLTDYTLMASVRTCWKLLRPGFSLREVHVRHRGQHYGREAERVFGCRVHFQKPDDRIVFPARDLDRPLRSANPLAGAQIEKALAALPASPLRPPTFEGRVEQAARGLLVVGRHPEQAMVAKRLHVSVRSLQRRLGDEHTTFRAVRDGVLRALVEAQLWNPALSIKEIALGLGYADAAALSKAYRRWTGQPPSAFRETALSGPSRRRASAARLRAT